MFVRGMIFRMKVSSWRTGVVKISAIFSHTECMSFSSGLYTNTFFRCDLTKSFIPLKALFWGSCKERSVSSMMWLHASSRRGAAEDKGMKTRVRCEVSSTFMLRWIVLFLAGSGSSDTGVSPSL